MKPCTKVGLEVTWRCNWRCIHCFYRYNDKLGTAYDARLDELLDRVDTAKIRGLNHAVMVGYGEPALYPYLGELLTGIRDKGMTSSMITNGTASLPIYKRCYIDWGLDHLHISSHAFGHLLDVITQRGQAGERQLHLKQWLQEMGLPFRTNATIQQTNFRMLPTIIQNDINLGAFHLVMIGFLPHYEWNNPELASSVAVDPALSRPYIEESADRLIAAQRLFTIRYHPLCHLSPKYWKYVVNARYVLFDPWEWNYPLQVNNIQSLWRESVHLGESVRVQEPCGTCPALQHCGGCNKWMVEATGCNLKRIELSQIPDEYRQQWNTDSGLFDMNPANQQSGVTPDFVRDSRRDKCLTQSAGGATVAPTPVN